MPLKPWITFQEKLEYQFKVPSLLAEALTHKSFSHERSSQPLGLFNHNERLEFLGDAVLDLTISHLLMIKDPQASEGELSKRRASLVNENTLAEIAREMEMKDYVILGRGEVYSKGREKNSIIASTVEAVLGAVYLDGGFDVASRLIGRLFVSRIDAMPASQPFEKDYKTRLQEVIQSSHKTAPLYKIEKTEGPEHEKIFQVAVMLGDKKLGEGIGRSRKEAEQAAAKIVLAQMTIEGLEK